jgi:hypothetical protein
LPDDPHRRPKKPKVIKPIMIRTTLALLLTLALGGCFSFSSSNPPPPQEGTTVVVPPGSSAVCSNGLPPPCE